MIIEQTIDMSNAIPETNTLVTCHLCVCLAVSGSSEYSHKDAFIQFWGWDPIKPDRTFLTDITAWQQKGSTTIRVNNAASLAAGMAVRIAMTDPGEPEGRPRG